MKQVESNLKDCFDIGEGRRFYRNKPIKTLLSLYQGNYLKLLWSCVIFLFKHTPIWVQPIALANIINCISSDSPNKLQTITINLIVLTVCVAINVPLAIMYARCISQATRDVEATIRIGLVRKLQVLSIPFYKHLETGKLQSKVLRDVESITNLGSRFCYGIMPIIINFFVIFGVTITKDFRITIFFFLSVPLCVLVTYAFRKNMRSVYGNFRKDVEQMSATVSQMIEMVPITRAHALEDIEIKKNDDALTNIKETGCKVDVMGTALGAASWTILQLMQIVCLAFTVYLAFQQEIQVGDIVVYQSYFSNLLGLLNTAIGMYPDIAKGVDSTASLSEIFLSDDIENYQGKPKVDHVEGNYEFDNISFRYDDSEEDEYVLKDFKLSVKKGESIAFVGESGGGKSTLVNMVIGFLKPTKGRLLLDGHDMSEIDLQSYRKDIAVVPQNTILFYGTIRDNITYGVEGVSEERLQEVIEIACLTDVIEKLPKGLDTVVGEHGDILSGGQKQRIAIARALIREPKVIILDEATSALDNQSEIHIQKAMKNLTKDKTTFMVAHRLSTIMDADKIVVVENGKVLECGNYQQLMEQKGAFYKLENLRKQDE